MSIIDFFFKKTLDEVQLKDVNLESYQGKRYERYLDGKVVEFSDTRDIFHEKASRLNDLKERAAELLNERAPLFQQINDLNGRLTSKESLNLRAEVEKVRNDYANKKQIILNALTFDEIDVVNLDE